MIRQALASNVTRLRDVRFSTLPNKTARNRALAKEIGSTLSQIQRICGESEQKSGCSIDFLELLAEAFDVSPKDLVTPYFSITTIVERSSEENSTASLYRRPD